MLSPTSIDSRADTGPAPSFFFVCSGGRAVSASCNYSLYFYTFLDIPIHVYILLLGPFAGVILLGALVAAPLAPAATKGAHVWPGAKGGARKGTVDHNVFRGLS